MSRGCWDPRVDQPGTRAIDTPPPSISHEALERALRGFLRGHADRDDALQEAFLQLSRERSTRPVRQPLAWLRRAARTLMMRNARGAARRRAREECCARPEQTESTVDEAARSELRQLLVASVLDLAEPYRIVVWMRYFEACRPQEIADRLTLPVGTVHSRLHRGLMALRTEVERRGMTERDLAIASPSPWPLWFGALSVMKAATILSALTLLGLLVMGFLVRDHEVDREEQSASANTTAPRGAPPLASATQETRTEHLALGTTSSTARSTDHMDSFLVHGQLVGRHPLVPWTVPLRIAPAGEFGVASRERSVAMRPDEHGTFRFALDPFLEQECDALEIVADDPRYLPVYRIFPVDELELRAPNAVAIAVSCVGVVTGVVLDDLGRSMSGACVAAFPPGEHRPVAEGRTDREGRFLLRVPCEGSCVVAAVFHEEGADSSWLGASGEINITVGGSSEIAPLVMGKGEEITGTIRNAYGDRFEGFLLHAYAQPDVAINETLMVGERLYLKLPGGILAPRVSFARSTENGQYRFSGLAPLTYRVVMLRHPSVVVHGVHLERVVGAPSQGVEFVLPGEVVTLEVRTRSKLVPKVDLMITSGRVSTNAPGLPGRVELVLPTQGDVTIMARADGCLPGSLRLSVERPMHVVTHTLYLEADEKAHRQGVRLHVLSSRGEPVKHVWVHWGDLEGDNASGSLSAQEEVGVFALYGHEPGEVSLWVGPPRFAFGPDRFLLQRKAIVQIPDVGIRDHTVQLGEGGRLRLIVRDPHGARPGGTLKLRTLEGDPVATAMAIFRRGSDGRVVSAEAAERGMFREGGPNETEDALPAGIYRVTVVVEGFAVEERYVRLVPGHITPLEVWLREVP